MKLIKAVQNARFTSMRAEFPIGGFKYRPVSNKCIPKKTSKLTFTLNTDI